MPASHLRSMAGLATSTVCGVNETFTVQSAWPTEEDAHWKSGTAQKAMEPEGNNTDGLSSSKHGYQR